MKKHIPIFYASDENYAKPLTVSMFSVLKNTSAHIDFFILENNISDYTKNVMKQNLDCFDNYSLTFIPVDMDKVKNFPNLNWYSLNMYSRYFIPEICKDLNKSIYLDVDIILKSDIATLYDTDLDVYALAAVVGEKVCLNNPYFKQHIQNLGVSNNHTYFGSGVLVFDMQQWRDKGYVRKLLEITQNNANKLKYPDQDALNILFDCNYKQLDLNWNRDLTCMQHEYSHNKRVIDDAFLIHYDGRVKPWKERCFGDEYFWNCAKHISFYKGSKFKITVRGGLNSLLRIFNKKPRH